MVCYLFYRGALTSKPYSFVARPWEFKSVEGVDFFDSTGSSIRFDIRGDKILRVLPRINESINEEWISDRTRFSVDGFRVQRIDRPFVKFDNSMYNLPWSKFINLLYKSILMVYGLAFFKNLAILSSSYNSNFFSFPFRVKCIGAFLDFEASMWLNFFKNTFFLKKLSFGFRTIFLNFRTNFLLPIYFKDLFKIKNLLLISVNPRFEAPVLNIRLRQSVVKFGNNISSFGQRFFSNFNLLVNAGSLSLVNFLNGNHWLCSYFTSKDSLILSNSSFASFINLRFFNDINNKQGLVGVFSRYSSYINAGESGVFVDDFANNKLPKLEFFVGKSKIKCNSDESISLVSTSHGFKQLHNFDFILPSSAPFEHNSTFINLEGRPQSSRVVLNSPNNVLDLKDSLIILGTLFFSNYFNKELVYKFSVFLANSVYSHFLLKKIKKDLWIFVYRVLSSFNSSRSSFIKIFYSSILEYVTPGRKLPLDEGCLDHNNGIFNERQQTLVLNRNSSKYFEAPDNFYVQDEIGLSSPTMLIGSERMGGVFYKTY
jgi:hypothetical protein